MQCRMNVLSLASILLLFAAASGAQTPGSSAALPHAQPQPGAQAGPHRITLDVEVTDKQGQHINGLQPQDFTLLDNKQPVKIVDFKEINSRSANADPVHVVIVVDAINTDFQAIARERVELDDYFKQDGGRLAHPTSLAMMTEKGIQIEKKPTTDGKVLLTSIDSSNSGLRMEGRTSGFYGAADRMEWSLGQLSQLAAYENTQPGLKLVFFISPGWPMFPMATQDTTTKDRQWTFNSVVALTNGLREAHVILYALDPFELGGRNPFLFQAYLKGVTKANDAQYPDLSLGVLSTHSGGTFQTTQMDVKGEIDKAIRDANSYYTISFESQPGDGADQYHALKLDVDKPGVTARTTTGYYSNVPR